MIQQLSWSITNLFVNRREIPEEDGEIYAFGFECILASAIQIFILVIAGLLFNCLIELAVYSLCFTQIKKHIGGWHANTHLACISGYTVVALAAVCLCSLLPNWVNYILLFIAISLIFAFAPIQHENNPKTDEEVNRARKISLLVSTVIAMCVCIISLSPYADYAIYGACGLLLASLSLIVPNKAGGEKE